jgi:hypothetical protein
MLRCNIESQISGIFAIGKEMLASNSSHETYDLAIPFCYETDILRVGQAEMGQISQPISAKWLVSIDTFLVHHRAKFDTCLKILGRKSADQH